MREKPRSQSENQLDLFDKPKLPPKKILFDRKKFFPVMCQALIRRCPGIHRLNLPPRPRAVRGASPSLEAKKD